MDELIITITADSTMSFPGNPHNPTPKGMDAIDALEMMSAGIIDPPIATRFPLEQINEAMDLLRSGKAHGRIVVDVSP